MGKQKIIYICGTGHCGSTLLDLIIGSADKVFSTGELAFYNVYRDEKDYKKGTEQYLCTCGEEFNSCPVWSEVDPQANLKIKKFFTAAEMLKFLMSLVFSFITPSNCDDTAELLGGMEDVLNRSNLMFLDSSKDPRRLWIILNDARLDVYPIHLVRKGEAVAYSYSRKNRIQESENFFISILKWIGVNVTARLLLKNVSHVRIPYEQFCKSPNSYIKELNEWMGTSIAEEDVVTDLNKTRYHSIDGNVLRFERVQQIKCDERWIKELSWIKKKIANIFLFPFRYMENTQ